ncbi:MAG TPA: outer-membrane lipoprotein carrier protein LolA [Longimicrobiales bacterium]|nr:outer-membrane lipoprotein carrier protein LolA [Longimicrobiales bacterium]
MRTALLVLVLGAAACGADRESATPGAEPAADAGAQLPVTADTMPLDAIDGAPPPVPPVPVVTATDGGGPTPAPGSAGDTPVQSPPAQAPAAQDEGAAILRRASAAYENVRSLKADFVMHYTNPLTRQDVTSRGTLYQRRPDRIALRFSEPAGDMLVGDGEYFYQYYPSVNAQQATRVSAGAADQSKVDLQAQFLGNPVERFDYTLHGAETVAGRQAHVLTLVPKVAADYRSLKVWVDARDGLARRFEITERNGVVRRFDLSGLETNGSIPDSMFRFTAPAGVRVITAG